MSKKRRLDLSADVHIKFAADADDEQLIPQFELAAYNGRRMRPSGFNHDVVVDLSSATAARNPLPILRSHDHDRVIGHGNIEIDSQRNVIAARGQISGGGLDADEIVRSAQLGFPWQASIGATADVQFIKAGKTIDINGEQLAGPIYAALNTRIHEISIVAIAADATTEVAVSAAAESEELSMPDEQTPQPISATQQLDADVSRALGYSRGLVRLLDEYPHQAEVIEAGREQQDPLDQIEASCVRADLRRVQRRRPLAAPAAAEGHSGEAQEINAAALEAALMRQHYPHANDDKMVAWYGERTLDICDQNFSSLTLHGLLGYTIHAAGFSHSPGMQGDAFIRRAFEANRKLEAADGSSQFSVPGILSNLANKMLLDLFQMVPSVVDFFCATRSLNDFKPHNSYRLEGMGLLEKVGADGQIQHFSLQETAYLLQAETWAKLLGISRKELINDDLSAFSNAVTLLGQAAIKRREYEAVNLLVNPGLAGDGVDFFHATHNNLITKALSIDGLTEAKYTMEKQVDSEGYPIMVMLDRLVVPSELAIPSRKLQNDTLIVTGSDVVLPNGNPHAGTFLDRSTPWASNSMVPNVTSTAYWGFSNPSVGNAAFYIGYVGNRQSPTVESSEMDFETLGMKWRIYWDWGLGLGDYRLAVKSSGTN